MQPKRLPFPTIVPPGLRFAREPRYRCPDCTDTGFVDIWKPRTIRQAVRDPDNTRWETCVVLCDCQAAEERQAAAGRIADKLKRKNSLEAVPVFGNEPWHIRAHAPDSKAKAATFNEIEANPNYYSELAAFAGPEQTT